MTSVGEVSPGLLRNRDFLRLWTGQVTSDLGTNSSLLVVPLLVLAITGSATWAGAVTTLGAAVSAVGRLPGGAVADRFGRRGLMVYSNLGRLLLHLALGVALLLDVASLWLVVGVVVVSAVLEVLFAPAEAAAIPRVVPAAQLKAAFAGNEARRSGASLAGPALGGAVYGLGPAVAFLAQALSYGLSALAIARIHAPLQDSRPRTSKRSIAQEVREGVSYVVGDRFLRAVILVAAPVNFALTGAIFCMTVALQLAGAGADEIGLAQACIGFGGLAGALAASRLIRRISLRRLTVLVCAALALAILAAAALNGRLVMVLPLAAGFFLAPAVNAALYARIGSSTPDHLLSRVLSVVLLAATGASALAPGVCGFLVDAAGPVSPLLVCAAFETLALVVALTNSGLVSDSAN